MHSTKILRQWSGLITLIVSRFLRHFEDRADMKGKPILFMLDEFASLGKIDGVTELFSTLRSKKITICAVIQSLALLDEKYGEATGRIIIDNCPYIAIFAVNDVKTQQYFSNMVGENFVYKKGFGLSLSGGLPPSISLSPSANIDKIREPLIYPEQFSTLKVIVLLTPDGVYRVNKLPYFYKYDISASADTNSIAGSSK